MFQAPKMTDAGKALYYDSLAGQGIVFTKIKLGQGAMTQPIATMTGLIDTVLSIDAAMAAAGDQSYVEISGSFSNADLAEGFYWREIGLFAANPAFPDDRSKDILYCYQNAYDTADFIPAASVETVEKHIVIPLVVSDAAQISCILNTSLVYATQQDIDSSVSAGIQAHNANQAAHADIRLVMSAHTSDTDVHVTAAQKTAWDGKAPGSLATTVSNHTGNADIHVTAAQKTTWDGKAPGSLSATVSGHTGNGTIHVTAADKTKWNGYQTVHTLGYSKSGTTHQLTGLTGLSGMVSCVFKATAAFAAGDTFTVDGVAYNLQLSNGETAEDNLFVSGATVPVVVDTSGKKVNFKAGGGLSNSKLALATAMAADVKSGKTFYAGNKTLKTGTLVPYKMKTGTVLIEMANHNVNIQVNCGFQANYVMTWYYKNNSEHSAAAYSNGEGRAAGYRNGSGTLVVDAKHCIAPTSNGFIIKNSYYLIPVDNDYLNYTAFGI